MSQLEIGVIGTGAMGKVYARIFSPHFRVNCCDLRKNMRDLQKEFAGSNVHVLRDAEEVAKRSDIIFPLVPVGRMRKSFSQWASVTKPDAIIAPGGSVMTPEVEAADEYLPSDRNFYPWHWLFGPSLNPQGRNTVLVDYRGNSRAYYRLMDVIEFTGVRVIDQLTFWEHDKITADTQAGTHDLLESQGTAWKNQGILPWEHSRFAGEIDNVEILLMLRLLKQEPHVASGLAFYNPYAKERAIQYNKSLEELSDLAREDKQQFEKRIKEAIEFVFRDVEVPIGLDSEKMRKYGFGISSDQRTANSYLGILALVDAWYQAKMYPYDNLICQTPLFRLLLGIAEHLCIGNPELLNETLKAATESEELREDMKQLVAANEQWTTLIKKRNTKGYHRLFLATGEHFSSQMEFVKDKSDKMIEELKAA